MTAKSVVLLAAHYLTDDILMEYARIRQSCSDGYDVVLLYDNFYDDLPVLPQDRDIDVHLVNPSAVQALGYPSWPGREHLEYTSPSGLRPGNWDFAILDYFRAHSDYASYWRVEYDVRFTGDWRFFLDACAKSGADLLGTTLLRHEASPPWYWWSSLGSPQGELDRAKMIRGFFPISRLSQRACALLDRKYKEGWYGHAECVMPTVLAYDGLSVEDIGGEGEFVPAGHENRFYVNTPSDSCLRPGTFVFRPTLAKPGSRPNTLWHPVRDEADHERWLHRLAQGGSAVAQFRMGVMCAKGQGVSVDMPEAYFWHHLAASGGHAPAEKWRDEIAKLLSPSELGAVQERLRQWKPRRPSTDRAGR